MIVFFPNPAVRLTTSIRRPGPVGSDEPFVEAIEPSADGVLVAPFAVAPLPFGSSAMSFLCM
jgi:hypothetical protein